MKFILLRKTQKDIAFGIPGSIAILLKKTGEIPCYLRYEQYFNPDSSCLDRNNFGETFITCSGKHLNLEFGIFELMTGVKVQSLCNITAGSLIASFYSDKMKKMKKQLRVYPDLAEHVYELILERCQRLVEVDNRLVKPTVCILEVGDTIYDYHVLFLNEVLKIIRTKNQMVCSVLVNNVEERHFQEEGDSGGESLGYKDLYLIPSECRHEVCGNGSQENICNLNSSQKYTKLREKIPSGLTSSALYLGGSADQDSVGLIGQSSFDCFLTFTEDIFLFRKCFAEKRINSEKVFLLQKDGQLFKMAKKMLESGLLEFIHDRLGIEADPLNLKKVFEKMGSLKFMTKRNNFNEISHNDTKKYCASTTNDTKKYCTTTTTTIDIENEENTIAAKRLKKDSQTILVVGIAHESFTDTYRSTFEVLKLTAKKQKLSYDFIKKTPYDLDECDLANSKAVVLIGELRHKHIDMFVNIIKKCRETNKSLLAIGEMFQALIIYVTRHNLGIESSKNEFTTFSTDDESSCTEEYCEKESINDTIINIRESEPGKSERELTTDFMKKLYGSSILIERFGYSYVIKREIFERIKNETGFIFDCNFGENVYDVVFCQDGNVTTMGITYFPAFMCGLKGSYFFNNWLRII